MLTVITPATNRKLTTVANLRSDLGLAADPNPTNASLERLIDQASSAIELFCNRVFAREELQDVFQCSAGQESLVLSRFPLVEIASITADGEVYDATAYADAPGGILTRYDEDGKQVVWGGGLISAVYTAGYYLPGDGDFSAAPAAQKLPAIIERACAMEVSALRSVMTRDPALKSQMVEGIGSRSWQVGPVAGGMASVFANPGVAAMLEPLRARNI